VSFSPQQTASFWLIFFFCLVPSQIVTQFRAASGSHLCSHFFRGHLITLIPAEMRLVVRTPPPYTTCSNVYSLQKSMLLAHPSSRKTGPKRCPYLRAEGVGLAKSLFEPQAPPSIGDNLGVIPGGGRQPVLFVQLAFGPPGAAPPGQAPKATPGDPGRPWATPGDPGRPRATGGFADG